MTRSQTSSVAQDWIDHDPDRTTADELSACTAEELSARFARPLRFGTAGLRGPLRGGPDGMNLAVILRTTWALAKVLHGKGLGGSLVVIGRDARHRSDDFALAAAEVLAAEGFRVMLLSTAVPTPIVAFTVRHTGAAAGIQITASHNPPGDNGFKLYTEDGLQVIPPTDAEVESAVADAPPADEIRRAPVEPQGLEEIQRYVARTGQIRRAPGSVRIALTPLHGVGGEFALDALVHAGLADVHVVESQFAPDPNFPTVEFPNPERPEAVEKVLDLAAEVDADVAIALDPDADRCAVGIPTPNGWRMLSGDETGWLLGEYILSQLEPGPVAAATAVASTVVSSRMLAAIAARHGARHVETLTGFKWLTRADADLPGSTLVYAYEEAIGHCVDPEAVRDKDGITAAIAVCDLIAALKDAGRTVPDALDDLARIHGVHSTTAVTRDVADLGEATAFMASLRANPPQRIAGFEVTVEDLSQRHAVQRTDALIMSGSDGHTSVRVVTRPSGTEPKVKSYIEVRRECEPDLATSRTAARGVQDDVVATVAGWSA